MVVNDKKLAHIETKLRSFHRILFFAAQFGIDINEIKYITDAFFDKKPCQIFCIQDTKGKDYWVLLFDDFSFYVDIDTLTRFEFNGMLKFTEEITEEGGEEHENDQIEAH